MNKIDQLEKLKKHLDEGTIDFDEFNKLKKELLADESKLTQSVNIGSQANQDVEFSQNEKTSNEINSNPKDNHFAEKPIRKKRNKILIFVFILFLFGASCFFYIQFGSSKNIGYAIGAKGTILKSNDGGTTWAELSSGTTKDLNSVFFIDTKIGYAVGCGGTIIKTTDGGGTWAALSSGTTADLGYVYFSNLDTGFVVTNDYGDGQIHKTTNGGATWTILNCVTKDIQNSGGGRFLSGCFIDANTGFVVGRDGLIIKTNDGGKTWSDKNNNISLDKITISLTSPHGEVSWKGLKGHEYIGFSSICITDSNIGYAVGGSIAGSAGVVMGSFGTIIKTIDGGNSWSEIKIGTKEYNQNESDIYEFYSVSFVDNKTGFVVGAKGRILKTIDGGVTWATIESGSTKSLTSVYFTDVNTGYVFGEETFLKTTDGGSTWLKIDYGKSNKINSICFPYFLGKKTQLKG